MAKIWGKENGWHTFYTHRGQIRPQGRIKPIEGGYESSFYNGHSGYVKLGSSKYLWTAKKMIIKAYNEVI